MGDAAPPPCIRSYQALVTLLIGQTERRWSILSRVRWLSRKQTNNMGGATLPSYIQSYQTPVTPVRGHGREGGGAILNRVRWLSTEQTNNMGAATLPSCIRSYQTPVTPARGHGHQRGGAILSHLSKMAVNKTNMGDAAPPSCIRS